jgi:hypothetical protein
MSALVHCDGPDCEQVEPAQRRLCDAPWLRLERGDYEPTLHFHSRGCLAAWSLKLTGASPAKSEPCMCDGSQLDPHTVAEHSPRPGRSVVL